MKTPRAHLFGVPNSLLGSLYYPALAIAIWFVQRVRGRGRSLLAAVVSAAATSVVLGLFATLRDPPRMPVLLDLPRR